MHGVNVFQETYAASLAAQRREAGEAMRRRAAEEAAAAAAEAYRPRGLSHTDYCEREGRPTVPHPRYRDVLIHPSGNVSTRERGGELCGWVEADEWKRHALARLYVEARLREVSQDFASLKGAVLGQRGRFLWPSERYPDGPVPPAGQNLQRPGYGVGLSPEAELALAYLVGLAESLKQRQARLQAEFDASPAEVERRRNEADAQAWRAERDRQDREMWDRIGSIRLPDDGATPSVDQMTGGKVSAMLAAIDR